MRLAVLTLTLALAFPARAEDAASKPADPPPAADAADAAAATASGLALPEPPPAVVQTQEAVRLARFGLLLDAGFPEGVAVSAVFRPVAQVRVFAGPAWSGVAYGVQGGLTLIPWQIGISPLFSLEAGRYFAADASFLARNSIGVPEEIEPLLRDVTYDFAAAHVGFELGTKNAFALSLRAGLAHVSLVARGRATVADGSGSGTVVTFVDPHVTGTIPSLKLGLQLWF